MIKRWIARGKWVWGMVGAALVAGLVIVIASFGTDPVAGLPTCKVARGEFQITLFESGELQAARGEKVSCPQVGGDLKIVYLWPEGEKVEVGNLILQFDKAEFEKYLRDTEGELQKAQADLSKGQATQEQQLSDLQTNIARSEAGLELAKLKRKQAEYDTPIQREEAEIGLKRAERALEQARKDLEVRKLVNKVELAKLQLRIAQTQKNYDRVKKDYDRLSVYATRPGIVVYEKIRKGGGREEKVKVGDSVWGNMTLLSLPDLSAMQVVSQVGEMDVQQVRQGQRVFVRLDAFPGPVFHGKVSKVAPMANPQIDAPNVQVFELIVDIEEQDDRLKPGMSASVEIVVETLAEVLSVPLEAVHEKEGRSFVYCLRGSSFKSVEVQLGKQNAVAAVVESGLQEGETIVLKEPALL